MVAITWLGHAMFLIEGSTGITIITDPYSEKTGYTPPEVTADIVTVSHDHYDHNNRVAVGGMPRIVDDVGISDINNTVIEGIASFHDEVKGQKRGSNTIFKFSLDGITIAHMGDFGEPITREQVDALRDVDVLLVPVGGTYTLDAEQAAAVVDTVKPRVVIPMHYKTKDCVINIKGVEPFLTLMTTVVRKGSRVELTASTLPTTTEVWVMHYIQ